MTDAHLTTRGGMSYLARPGPGPTVVLLHGIGSNATSFLPLFALLPGHLNVLAWNAPGYLDSTPLKDPWPVAQGYAAALAGFLDDLAIKAAHLVGHSLGTLMATSFARQFPRRVQSLVLASAAHGYGVATGSQMPPKVAARIDDLNTLGPEAFAKARAANLVYQPDQNADIVAQVAATMRDVNPAGYAQAVHMLASGSLPHDLAHVPIRPGFIIGAQDRVTPLDQTLTAASAWETAHDARPDIHQIDGAGHAVYLQKPKAFCAAVIALIDATPQDQEEV